MFIPARLSLKEYQNWHNAKLKLHEKSYSHSIKNSINSNNYLSPKEVTYDPWGDTVNCAARLEAASEPAKINISETTYQLIKEEYNCDFRGEIEAKNRGKLKMYFVGDRKSMVSEIHA